MPHIIDIGQLQRFPFIPLLRIPFQTIVVPLLQDYQCFHQHITLLTIHIIPPALRSFKLPLFWSVVVKLAFTSLHLHPQLSICLDVWLALAPGDPNPWEVLPNEAHSSYALSCRLQLTMHNKDTAQQYARFRPCPLQDAHCMFNSSRGIEKKITYNQSLDYAFSDILATKSTHWQRRVV